MGNGVTKLSVCFIGAGEHRRKNNPLDDECLGHSFVYVRPDPFQYSSNKVHSADETTVFRTISGAAVSANTSNPLSTAFLDLYTCNSIDKSSTFESSYSFSSIPLQPIPRNLANSGQFSGNFERILGSGPIERRFLSGPIERGVLSGTIETGYPNPRLFQRSSSHGGFARGFQKAIAKTFYRRRNAMVTPIKAVRDSDLDFSNGGSLDDDEDLENQNVEWAQGKAGEDRVHVVVSEKFGWVFVGIYDGFNGPDATDYLVSNLYSEVRKELKGLLWDEKVESMADDAPCSSPLRELYPSGNGDLVDSDLKRQRSKNSKRRYRGAGMKWKENQRRWKCQWNRERLELDRRLKEELNHGSNSINHSDVLKALSRALKRTEMAYLEVADKVFDDNPELALVGSCVLVMLMKGEDVYVMNVGDSRAVLASKTEPDYHLGKIRQDLECIDEETLHDLESSDVDRPYTVPLTSFQLTMDHSTKVDKEVRRIKDKHPDDSCAVMNGRVKGSLNVTRAFGAGFLKQPKWNNALLEMFRIDYVGTCPYIDCLPSLYHHRLGKKDQFLILSSDGLYQYFTNKEAVSEVELFIALQPEGDPAQHLVEEVLFRAAKKAGIDFHQLLEIPQGDRRRYHDDISIIIISLEGIIWRSCV